MSVIAHRRGEVVLEIAKFTTKDTTKVASRLRRKMANQTDLAVIDVIGVGSGVVDMARRWGDRSIHAFNASRKTKRKDRSGLLGFKNQRSAMWWMVREMLDPAFDSKVMLPPDEDLAAELSSPHWRETPGGLIQVESKDDVRARLGRSTDSADAVLQTFMTDTEFNEAPETAESGIFQFTDAPDWEDSGYVAWGSGGSSRSYEG